MAYIISHLANYNVDKNDFVKGDWVATLGNTGESFGIHGHLQDVPGAKTITDFYRSNCTGKVIEPNINAILDMNNYTITLGYYNTSEEPYSPSRPHFGIDFITKSGDNKLIMNVPIQVIEKGFDSSFGNYIIFEVLWGQGTPAPTQENGTFVATRQNRNSDNGRFTFPDSEFSAFSGDNVNGWTTTRPVTEVNDETWKANTFFNHIGE
jgi:hypothetical protein